MTDQERANEIAAGLSEAQRKQILRAKFCGQFWEIHCPADDDLSELEYIGVTGEDGWENALTPLGLAVRHLLAQGEGEKR